MSVSWWSWPEVIVDGDPDRDLGVAVVAVTTGATIAEEEAVEVAVVEDHTELNGPSWSKIFLLDAVGPI